MYHPEQEHEYGGDDLQVLLAIANCAAIAIENVRLLEQVRQKVNELEVLRQLAADLAAIERRSQV